VGEHTPENPERNLTRDPWWTDGNRVVLFFTNEEITPDQVHLSDWREPETAAGAEAASKGGGSKRK